MLKITKNTFTVFNLCVFLSSCSMLKTYPDSPAEEWVEAAILEYSGLDIDFTSTDGK